LKEELLVKLLPKRGYPRGDPVSAQGQGYSCLEAGLTPSPKGEAEFNHQGEAQTHICVILNQSNSKYFEI